MSLVSAHGVYCIYDNKPHALSGFEIVPTNQLSFFFPLSTLTAPYVKRLSTGGSPYCTLLLKETAAFCNHHILNSRIDCLTCVILLFDDATKDQFSICSP